jgi:hypothetical protein
LTLIVTEPRILKVLEITGLVGTFTIRGSRDALVARAGHDDSVGGIGEVS